MASRVYGLAGYRRLSVELCTALVQSQVVVQVPAQDRPRQRG